MKDTAEGDIRDACWVLVPAGRNTGPPLYTDQSSASCETFPAEKKNRPVKKLLRQKFVFTEIETVPLTSIYDNIPEKETSIPLTVYGSSTNWLPLNTNPRISVKKMRLGTQYSLRLFGGIHSLFSHLFNVVTWTGIIRNL